jgi:hypothetical protein
MNTIDIHNSMEAEDFEGLCRALDQGEAQTRITAMQALGKLGDHRAANPLGEKLRDPDVEIRRTAARVLYQMLATGAIEELDKETIRHILRFRAPEEILVSPTAIRLFLETLDVLKPGNTSLDIEHGDGSMVSGTPMEDYQALTLRKSGTEHDLDKTVRRALSFFEAHEHQTEGWWTIGPMRGLGVIAFRQGDRFGETLYELAIARITADHYLTLSTTCRYADWD